MVNSTALPFGQIPGWRCLCAAHPHSDKRRVQCLRRSLVLSAKTTDPMSCWPNSLGPLPGICPNTERACRRGSLRHTRTTAAYPAFVRMGDCRNARRTRRQKAADPVSVRIASRAATSTRQTAALDQTRHLSEYLGRIACGNRDSRRPSLIPVANYGVSGMPSPFRTDTGSKQGLNRRGQGFTALARFKAETGLRIRREAEFKLRDPPASGS